MILGMYLLDQSIYMLFIMGSVLLHELFHLWMIKKINGRIKSITLKAFRISIELPQNLISYRDEIKIAFAGPCANLLILSVTILICLFYKSFPGAAFLCATNILIFIINMIPIEFLDGGRILKAYLLTQMDLDTADIICSVISGCCIFPLLGAGIMLLIQSGYNFSLLAIGVFLLINFIARIRAEHLEPIGG